MSETETDPLDERAAVEELRQAFVRKSAQAAALDADRRAMRTEAQQIEAERDRLRGVVEAVRALADECAGSGCVHLNEMWGRLIAALASVPSSGGAESGEGDDRERGLYGKYRVERISDPTGKHADCGYFVLDPQHDPHAVTALRAYADACAAEYPALAADLRAWVGPAPVVSGGQADGEGEVERESMQDVADDFVTDWGEVLTRDDLAGVHDWLLRYRLAARPVLSREAIARALHAWDVEGGPCGGPWDGLTEHQREVWRSGADAVLAVLVGQEER